MTELNSLLIVSGADLLPGSVTALFDMYLQILSANFYIWFSAALATTPSVCVCVSVIVAHIASWSE